MAQVHSIIGGHKPMVDFRVIPSLPGFIIVLWLLSDAGCLTSFGSDRIHPLDPLTAEDILAVKQILLDSGRATKESRFSQVIRREPSKREGWGSADDGPFPREASVILIDRPGGNLFRGIVDIPGRRVVAWIPVEGAKPALLGGDYATIGRILRADPGWLNAIKKRGIDNPDDVQIDGWASGCYGGVGNSPIRSGRAFFFHRPKESLTYMRPIGGLAAQVDLDRGIVMDLIDLGVVPLPSLASPSLPRPSPELPVGVESKPATPSRIQLNGNRVEWHDWRFRVALEPREGLILYTVGFQEAGRIRPILYRGAISELLVPYGDPARDWFIRNAFDAGEYGIGRFANSLQRNVDCPAGTVYLDSTLATDEGNPHTIHRSIGIYERDGGVLWKHGALGRPEGRRTSELCVCSFSTLDNYVYGFQWVFRRDGSISVEVLLTGIMLTKGVNPDLMDMSRMATSFGHLVAPGVVAVNHQHFFNFRLDFDIEGSTGNSVMELNTEALAIGPDNPHGNAFVMRETEFLGEDEAQRSLNPASGRCWKVVNRSVRSPLGHPAGYRLMPGEGAIPFAAPSAPFRQRARFLDSHLWSTPYDPDEMYATGSFPNENRVDSGIPIWTKANRSLRDQDVVLWYTLGVNHLAQPEQWPVMPVHRVSFSLVPDGFFLRSPALDVPPDESR